MSTENNSQEPIIIIRKVKKKGAAAFSGGMWKVAYADFITAMMAFFLMLWILNSTPEETLEGVAKYFTVAESSTTGAGDNLGISADSDTGIPTEESKNTTYSPHNPSSSGSRMTKFYGRRNMTSSEDTFSSIVNNIQKNIEMQDYQQNIAFDMTSEGMRIQIMDSDNRPMFKPNTDLLQPYMQQILKVVGKMIKVYPNYLAITGHTNTSQSESADIWWLSAARANQVRSFLTDGIIKDSQVIRILGKADRDPINPNNPADPKNIRISILLIDPDKVANHQRATPK